MDQPPPLPPEVPPPTPAPKAERQYLFGSKAADIILAIIGSIGLPILFSLQPALLIGGLFITTFALIEWRTNDPRTALFFKTWMIVWGGTLVVALVVVGACIASFKW
jgi:hypothetical protein